MTTAGHAGDLHNRQSNPDAPAMVEAGRNIPHDFDKKDPPPGFMAAVGDLASSVVSLVHPGKDHAGDDNVGSTAQPSAQAINTQGDAAKSKDKSSSESTPGEASLGKTTTNGVAEGGADAVDTRPFDNGYHFPPKYSWGEATRKGLLAFWGYFTTPLGFLVVIYGLNVVAWGGMLFLLLCNASPVMCAPTCDDIDSPRRVWVEYDSQIINALFCVTGFGLAPWRFRDWYHLLRYRVLGKQEGLRRLAAIHRGWFRLPLGAAPPLPEEKAPDAPLSGTRAPATPTWRMDFVVWSMVLNTFFQVVLSVFMWALNRYNRPSWATGLFVALGMIVAAAGGIMMFVEGKRVKSIEGVPLTERDLEKLSHDKELGIPHYNNIKDKKPKDKVERTGSKRSQLKEKVTKTGSKRSQTQPGHNDDISSS